MKNKSATQEVSSYVTLNEGGKSQGKIYDARQWCRILKNQHIKSRKGSPSLLLKLLSEAKKEKKK